MKENPNIYVPSNTQEKSEDIAVNRNGRQYSTTNFCQQELAGIFMLQHGPEPWRFDEENSILILDNLEFDFYLTSVATLLNAVSTEYIMHGWMKMIRDYRTGIPAEYGKI